LEQTTLVFFEADLVTKKTLLTKDRQLVAVKQIEVNEEMEFRIRKEVYLQWYLTKEKQDYFVKLFGWCKAKEKETILGEKVSKKICVHNNGTSRFQPERFYQKKTNR